MLGHRRRGVHRLEPGRCAAGARRRGDGRRRPLDRAAGEPRRGAGERAPTLVEADIRDAAAVARLAASPPGPRSSSTWRRRSTCASRSPTRPSTPRSTSAAPPTCWRRRGRRVRGASSSSPPAARSTARARARSCRCGEDAPIAPLSAYGQSKFAAEGYVALYERLLRAVGGEPAAGQRLRPAPGPARRGGGDRDLLRQAAGRRAADRVRRRHARPATTYMWATWSRRRWRRRSPRRPGRSTSAPGSRPTCSSWSARLGELGGAEGFEPEFAPPRTGEVQRISIDPARAGRELGWSAKVGLEEGLRLTLDSL